MSMQTQEPFFESRQVKVIYNADDDWIEVFWRDYPKDDDVMVGSNQILDAIKKYQVSKLLVSHQAIKGTWTNMNDWIRTEWTPRAVQAGLKQVAIVYSEDVFAKFALKDMVKTKGADFISVFGTIADAKNWLKEA